MRFSRAWNEWRDWEARTPRGRRAARTCVFLCSTASLLAALVSLLLAEVGSVFRRHEALVLTFESAPGATFDADGGIRSSVSPLGGVEDVVVASFGRFHLASVLVDGKVADPWEHRRRIHALLPPSVKGLEAFIVPIVPESPSLSTLHTPGDAVKLHGALLHALIPRWHTGLHASRASGIQVIPDPARSAHFGISDDDIAATLTRALASRPPLVGKDRNRILASAWDGPFPDQGALMAGVLEAPIERTGRPHVPLSDVARVVVDRAPEGAAASIEGAPPIAALRTRAETRWITRWGRVDGIVLGSMILATVVLALCAGSGPLRIDLGLIMIIPALVAIFVPVTPLADAAPYPQVRVAFLLAGLWGSLRTFPWSSRRRLASVRWLAPWVAATVPLLTLVWIWNVPATRDEGDGLGGKEKARAGMAFSSRLRGNVPAAKPVADGDSFPSVGEDGFRAFDTLLTSGEKVRVGLIDVSSAAGAAGESKLALRRDGGPARLEPLPSGWKSPPARVARGWTAIAFLCSALASLFLSRSAWVVVPSLLLQVCATGVATLLADAFARFAYEEDPARRGLESVSALGGYVVWFVLALTVAFAWIVRRTEHFQRRQFDPVDARRRARRHLRTAALTLGCVLGTIWPLALLFESVPSTLLLSTASVAFLFATPCVAVYLSMRASDSISFARLSSRVRSFPIRALRRTRSVVRAAFLVFAIAGASAACPPGRALADSSPIDASCRDVKTEIIPVLSFPRKGEPIAERREITLQLLGLVPCSSPAEGGLPALRALVSEGLEKGQGVQEVVDALLSHFRASAPPPAGTRVLFGLVSEFYDNLSLTLFELSAGHEPVFLKLTMRRDDWSRGLDTLRTRFGAGEASFIESLDATSALRTVRIRFAGADGTAVSAPGLPTTDPTLARLRSELAASTRSRYRNPLPPRLWERRSFFRLATDAENPDAELGFRVELSGTRVYAQVTASVGSEARSQWLEGSLASLPDFERKLHESSRDMLMELVGIYDYSVTLGPEFTLSGQGLSTLAALAVRHNRGDLAATLRMRLGRFLWEEACDDKPLLFDLSLLPGWQFLQTERISLDAGVLVGLGLLDASFGSEAACRARPEVDTHITAGYGAFLQANYTTFGGFSVLGRVGGEGLVLFPAQEKADSTVRSQRFLSLSLGIGLAL